MFAYVIPAHMLLGDMAGVHWCCIVQKLCPCMSYPTLGHRGSPAKLRRNLLCVFRQTCNENYSLPFKFFVKVCAIHDACVATAFSVRLSSALFPANTKDTGLLFRPLQFVAVRLLSCPGKV